MKNDIVKKAVCDKLAAIVNNTDTSTFVLKTKYQLDKAKLRKKFADVTTFVKVTKPTDKIPDISGLATKTALTAVENKIPDVSSLVKKQIITQKLVRLKRNLLIIIATNILLLLLLLLIFLIQD